MAVDHGALVIGDISGYTGYLTGVKLQHSHDVIAICSTRWCEMPPACSRCRSSRATRCSGAASV